MTSSSIDNISMCCLTFYFIFNDRQCKSGCLGLLLSMQPQKYFLASHYCSILLSRTVDCSNAFSDYDDQAIKTKQFCCIYQRLMSNQCAKNYDLCGKWGLYGKNFIQQVASSSNAFKDIFCVMSFVYATIGWLFRDQYEVVL